MKSSSDSACIKLSTFFSSSSPSSTSAAASSFSSFHPFAPSSTNQSPLVLLLNFLNTKHLIFVTQLNHQFAIINFLLLLLLLHDLFIASRRPATLFSIRVRPAQVAKFQSGKCGSSQLVQIRPTVGSLQNARQRFQQRQRCIETRAASQPHTALSIAKSLSGQQITSIGRSISLNARTSVPIVSHLLFFSYSTLTSTNLVACLVTGE